MRRVFALPVLRRLLCAFTIEQFAVTIAPLALSVLVYRQTGSALGAASFFICSDVAPVVFGPPIVARLDRSPPRLVLPIMYGAQAVLFGALAWLVDHFSLAPLLVITVVTGSIGMAARSLVSATRTSILRPHDLLRDGNAVVNIIFSTIFFAGPLIGGAIVAAGGSVAALLAVCGLFVLIGGVLAVTDMPEPTGAEAAAGEGNLRRLRRGVTELRGSRFISRLLTMQFIGLIFFSLTIPVEVIYAQHTLHAGPGGYGTLLAVWGGGALIGSAAYARWRHATTTRLLTGSSVALLVGFGVMAVAGSLPLALIGDAVGGVGNGIWAIAARTAIQERCDDRWMAITMSVSDSATMVAPGVGIVIGGVIASLGDARAAFAAGAVGALAFALAAPIALRGSAAPPVPPRTNGVVNSPTVDHDHSAV